MASRTIGVEEEYLLVDGRSGGLRPVNDEVLAAARPAMGESVHLELKRSQVEASTPVCTTLDQIADELRGLRARLNEAAARYGSRLAAAGTHPTAPPRERDFTESSRYLAMADQYQETASQMLICGCHVHVGIEDPDLRIGALNRIRPWLPTLLALSANSPYWAGDDTGYASYRTMVFRPWPTAGMPQRFNDYAEYERVVATLVAAGAVEDATHLYWYARPSARFPTVEVRIADVCLSVEEAVTVAGLVAAMVATACQAELNGSPLAEARPELLEAAVWRAARYGLTDRLIDVDGAVLRPAAETIAALLATLRPALEAAGDWETVSAGVARVLAEGTGAERQRAIRRRGGSAEDVIAYIARQTAA
ncbi:MAG: carboxylate-amine ligase [Acidimicrobiales bacterium]